MSSMKGSPLRKHLYRENRFTQVVLPPRHGVTNEVSGQSDAPHLIMRGRLAPPNRPATQSGVAQSQKVSELYKNRPLSPDKRKPQGSQSVSAGQSVSSAISTASSPAFVHRKVRRWKAPWQGDCCGMFSDWWANKFMGGSIGQGFWRAQLTASTDSFTFGSAPSTTGSERLRQERYSGRIELTPPCCNKDVAEFMAGLNGQPKRVQITPVSKIPTMMRQVEMDCSVIGSSSSSGDGDPPPSQLFYQEYQRRKNIETRPQQTNQLSRFGLCPE